MNHAIENGLQIGQLLQNISARAAIHCVEDFGLNFACFLHDLVSQRDCELTPIQLFERATRPRASISAGILSPTRKHNGPPKVVTMPARRLAGQPFASGAFPFCHGFLHRFRAIFTGIPPVHPPALFLLSHKCNRFVTEHSAGWAE